MKSLLVLVVLLLAACAQTPAPVTPTAQPTYTPFPTLTPYPTFTPYPTLVPIPTYTAQPTLAPKIIIVTATPLPETPTPQGPTETPAPTADLSKTQAAEAFARLTADKEPGIYLINEDIAPGVWRNNGGSGDCYWKVSTRTGDIINNFFGMGGGTMYVPPTGFQVEMHQECGVWKYLGK